MLVEIDYCKCEEVTSVYTKKSDAGQCDICCVCKKPIEGSFVRVNIVERG